MIDRPPQSSRRPHLRNGGKNAIHAYSSHTSSSSSKSGQLHPQWGQVCLDVSDLFVFKEEDLPDLFLVVAHAVVEDVVVVVLRQSEPLALVAARRSQPRPLMGSNRQAFCLGLIPASAVPVIVFC